MPKVKTEFDPDCFGTINKEEKSECNHCSYSEECDTFKQPLADYISSAAEKARTSYLEEKAEVRSITLSKLLGYGLTIGILIFVFWQISKDV